MKFLKNLNQFLIGILAAVFLGWLFAEVGAKGGLLRTEITTKVAVFIIFLNQGLTLPTEDLKRGFLQWRFHLFCFLFIFLFFPGMTGLGLLGLNAMVGGAEWWTSDLQLGFLFLGILPTTITTAVVYAGKSGGNVGSAIFSTAFTNVAGIFIVPLASLYLASSLGILDGGGTYSALPIIGKILLLLFLPFVLGQCLRPWLKGWVGNHKNWVRNANVYLVYFIVFAAFANSFQQDTWAQFPLFFLGVVFLLTGLMLLFFTGTAWLLVSALGFDRGDRISGLFCGSQKTLAAGIPLASSIFIGARPDMGLVILPLMIYHPLQLILHGYFVGRWEKTAEE